MSPLDFYHDFCRAIADHMSPDDAEGSAIAVIACMHGIAVFLFLERQGEDPASCVNQIRALAIGCIVSAISGLLSGSVLSGATFKECGGKDQGYAAVRALIGFVIGLLSALALGMLFARMLCIE